MSVVTVLSFILVGALWGCTTPFIKRGEISADRTALFGVSMIIIAQQSTIQQLHYFVARTGSRSDYDSIVIGRLLCTRTSNRVVRCIQPSSRTRLLNGLDNMTVS